METHMCYQILNLQLLFEQEGNTILDEPFPKNWFIMLP
jgi:hypothetical protein